MAGVCVCVCVYVCTVALRRQRFPFPSRRVCFRLVWPCLGADRTTPTPTPTPPTPSPHPAQLNPARPAPAVLAVPAMHQPISAVPSRLLLLLLLLCSPLRILVVAAPLEAAQHTPRDSSAPSWRTLSDAIINKLRPPSVSQKSLGTGSHAIPIGDAPGWNLVAHFQDDMVLRFTINTPEEALAFQKAADDLFLEVWEYTSDWVDVRIPRYKVRGSDTLLRGCLLICTSFALCSTSSLRPSARPTFPSYLASTRPSSRSPPQPPPRAPTPMTPTAPTRSTSHPRPTHQRAIRSSKTTSHFPSSVPG